MAIPTDALVENNQVSEDEKGNEIESNGMFRASEPDISEHESGADSKDTKTKKVKVIQSLVLYTGFIVLGIGGSIVGPSLLDLQITSGASSEDITLIYIPRAVGGILGAAITGLVINRYSPWLLLAISLLFGGALNAAFPWCYPMASLMAVIAIGGIAGGFFDAEGNVALLMIWKSENGPWMQALHCIFGIGTWLGPLIVKPFLAENNNQSLRNNSSIVEEQNETVVYQSGNNLNFTPTTSIAMNSSITLPNDTEPMKTDIAYAYFIIFVLSFIVFIAYLIIWYITDRKVHINREKITKKTKETKKRLKKSSFEIQLIVLVFFFYLIYGCLEMNFANYLSMYTVKYLGWSSQDGASVTSAFWGAFTVARGAGIIFVNYIRPQIFLAFDVTMTTLALVPILLFVKQHNAVLWVCTVIFGTCMATIYALGITWTERYIKLTGPVGTIFMIAGAGGELVGPVIISLLFRTFGYYSYMYIMFSFAVGLLIVFCFMQLLACRKGERYDVGDKTDMDVKYANGNLAIEEKSLRSSVNEPENDSLEV